MCKRENPCDDQKYEQIQKALRREHQKDFRVISDWNKFYYLFVVAYVSCNFCLVGVTLCLKCGGRYGKESDPGKWMGNYSIDCDGSYIKSQTMQVRSLFLLHGYNSNWVCWITLNLLSELRTKICTSRNTFCHPFFPLGKQLDDFLS